MNQTKGKAFGKARTLARLGGLNLARVAFYRFGVRTGLNPVRKLSARLPVGAFFMAPPANRPAVLPTVSLWQKSGQLFSHWPIDLSSDRPAWLTNPFTGQSMPDPERPWWQIADFDPQVGDIKLIWELSRFDWVLAFAQRAANGNEANLTRLNEWLHDWLKFNPPYQGPNWKCGQEASIRLMHLAVAALILSQVTTAPAALVDLLHLHLQRIAPTLQYAVAQDNNHGTSEAAALFIGGSWLATLGHKDGKGWADKGRTWLENRAQRLIGPQGSFSQYSLNYHRVMLDTFCIAEIWRRQLNLPSFSQLWQSRTLAAAQWLRHMINPNNGDGPNVGANDGARLLQLSNTSYRDFRPTVQMSVALMANQRAYAEDGPWNDALRWLNIDLPQALASPLKSFVADDGGFAMLHRGKAFAMLRYPRFRFRPSHADALHLDLWVDGSNVLRDDGTYSYNTEPQWQTYFGSTQSHNCVQFDDREQMPRLSKFLLGDWLKTNFLEPLQQRPDTDCFAAGYRDRFGAIHKRTLSLSDHTLIVTDRVEGFKNKAVLRWRLAPGQWQTIHKGDDIYVSNPDTVLRTMTIHATVPILRCEIVEGWESRHYLEKTSVPVLEVHLSGPCTITTSLSWTA